MTNLTDLLKKLLDHKLNFIIVGGFAATLHGSSMLTRDLDICMSIDSESIEALRDCLRDVNPVHRMTSKKLSFLDHPHDLSHVKNLNLETDLGVLDILGFVGGIGYFQDLKKTAIEVLLFGKTCKVISIDGLIEAKKNMGSAKDLATVDELEVIKRKLKDM